MTTEPDTPAEPPEPKRRLPSVRVGLLVLAALVLALMVTPFFRPLKFVTATTTSYMFVAGVVAGNEPPQGITKDSLGEIGYHIQMRLGPFVWALWRVSPDRPRRPANFGPSDPEKQQR